jgi:hypothetical protein
MKDVFSFEESSDSAKVQWRKHGRNSAGTGITDAGMPQTFNF